MDYSVSSVLYPCLNSSLHGISVDIFFNGCTHKCEGCHNRHLWSFKGMNTTLDELVDLVRGAKKAKVVSLMGGEPLQRPYIPELIDKLVDTGKQIALFTGYEFHKVPEGIKSEIDYLKVGRFQGDNRTPSGSFLASKNQVMYKKYKGIWVIDWEYKDEKKLESRYHII